LDHLNNKTKSKKQGPPNVLIDENEVVIIDYLLGMQECGLSTALQQLKLKVIKLTQIQVTPFKDEMPRNSWWYWVQV
jgi:hypothetical protein